MIEERARKRMTAAKQSLSSAATRDRAVTAESSDTDWSPELQVSKSRTLFMAVRFVRRNIFNVKH